MLIIQHVFNINISLSSDAVVKLISLLRKVQIFAVKNGEF